MMPFTHHYQQLEEHSHLGDQRLNKRYSQICKQLSNDISSSIPANHADRDQSKATYRFFSNAKISPDKLIAGHVSACFAKVNEQDQSFYLVLQDTTGVVYTGKKGAAQLGPLNYKHNRGFYLHSSLLTSCSGVPLGVFKQSFIERTQAGLGQGGQRRQWPIEQKETYRWLAHFKATQDYFRHYPNLQILEIADREADFYEFLVAYDSTLAKNVHYLIRSKHDRRIANTKDQTIQKRLAQSPIRGQYQVELTDRRKAKKRIAQVQLRYEQLRLQLHKPQGDKKNLAPLDVFVIQVQEPYPPKGTKAANWTLLTSYPVLDLATAKQLVKYYALRWLIERFHYILKQGANIEQLQLHTPDRLKNAITVYSIITITIMRLNYLARKHPNTNIYQAGISIIEYQALYQYLNQFVNKRIEFKAEHPPDIGDFVNHLALLGGFIKAKRQPFPGLKTMWIALAKFRLILNTFNMSKN